MRDFATGTKEAAGEWERRHGPVEMEEVDTVEDEEEEICVCGNSPNCPHP